MASVTPGLTSSLAGCGRAGQFVSCAEEAATFCWYLLAGYAVTKVSNVAKQGARNADLALLRRSCAARLGWCGIFADAIDSLPCAMGLSERRIQISLNTTLPNRSNPALETSPLKRGPLYLPQDRKTLLTILGALVVLTLLAAVGVLMYLHRSNVASAALADAMRTFETPVVPAGQPVPAGIKTFASTEERARAANGEFAGVANTYGMTPAGRNALYLQGVTAMQMGQNQTAETLLKKSAGGWNKDVAAMADLALAGLYHSTSRDADAVAIYQKLTNKPTTTVPPGLAQLQLADLYTSEGKKDQARKIYAGMKDKDPKSAAGEIATQNLGETPER